MYLHWYTVPFKSNMNDLMYTGGRHNLDNLINKKWLYYQFNYSYRSQLLWLFIWWTILENNCLFHHAFHSGSCKKTVVWKMVWQTWYQCITFHLYKIVVWKMVWQTWYQCITFHLYKIVVWKMVWQTWYQCITFHLYKISQFVEVLLFLFGVWCVDTNYIWSWVIFRVVGISCLS